MSEADAAARMSAIEWLSHHLRGLTLIVAGHETTAAALTWTWYLVSRHPRAAEQLHAEASRSLEGLYQQECVSCTVSVWSLQNR